MPRIRGNLQLSKLSSSSSLFSLQSQTSTMAPTIYAAKLTLSCPLFAADFDPRDNGRLFVGGGGGEGRSGVGNKISLIDTSRRDEITEAVELNLSRDEDSVTSLAVAPQLDDESHSLVTLAGINSSLSEQKKNNNEHMRAFRFTAPRKTQAVQTESSTGEETTETQQEKEKEKTEAEVIPGSSEAISRASIFRTKGPGSDDTYQRILRLSPWKKQANDENADNKSKDTRIGAIATGMASSGEIVFFRATGSPSESDVIGRIRLGANEEAEDVDFADLELDQQQKNTQGKYRMAYTNGVDVMVGEISSSTRSNAAPDVRNIYTIPLPSSGAKRGRSKIRALRFISTNTILLLQNAPDRGGSEIVLISAPTDKNQTSTILRRRKLPRSVKIGLGLDICPLGSNAVGQQQTIIAASGSDNSINIWTLESSQTKGWSKFRPFTTITEVHPFSMTKLVFSTFIPPSHPVTPEVLPQRVKLASISMGNTVVVHTIPLSPFPPSSRTPRYVLVAPGPAEIWELIYFTTMCLLSFLTILTALYAFAEIRGGVPPFLGSKTWLPISWRDTISLDYVVPAPEHRSFLDTFFLSDSKSQIPTAQVSSTAEDSESEGPNTFDNELSTLKQILDEIHSSGFAPLDIETVGPHDISVIVRCTEHADAETSVLIETASSTHAEKVSSDEKLRAWKELRDEDRDLWKRKLTDAGRWTVEQGEGVLKGVLFGEICGGVGRVVREGLE
ncbi:hypothetical protein PENSTE_c001G03851 [Penicillium steckii]|uniref:Guanine nucleotide-exchange factor SEC12 n=1 Tax=Penicillium steckii TaxID=303698 RepID=A0A1V6TYY6_9EURO|nr:hypothetical protein PENSTE_c001G03851 [Penicillium steckii]